MSEKAFQVLFVCLGNICRSPAAEGVMQHLVDEAGLSATIRIDSAGTESWHHGKLPDARMREAGKARGYTLQSRARQVKRDDLVNFDLILAMDADNLRNLRALDPEGLHATKIRAFCDYCTDHDEKEVPDPYYGGPEGFEKVLNLLEDGCANVLRQIGKV
jgi:protein-tyrosine phosphatase